jgi:hypothetical protein
MKIYNEITIDMNPESSSYGETMYEDSFEYNGDIMLMQDPTTADYDIVLYDADGDGIYDHRVFYVENAGGGHEMIVSVDEAGNQTKHRKPDSHDASYMNETIKNIAISLSASGSPVSSESEGGRLGGDARDPSFYDKPGGGEWGAPNLTKEMFVNEDGSMKNPEDIIQTLLPLLPGIEEGDLRKNVIDMFPKFEQVAEQEKTFLTTKEGYAGRTAQIALDTAKRTRAEDIYGLQGQAGQVGGAIQNVYGGGMGGGTRGAIAGATALGRGFEKAQGTFETAQDTYDLSMSKAKTAYDEGLYGLQEGAAGNFEELISNFIEPEWTTAKKGGYVFKDRSGLSTDSNKTFLDILTELPEAGGS